MHTQGGIGRSLFKKPHDADEEHRIHTYTHTYIHTYIHTYTHTYIHTNACTHRAVSGGVFLRNHRTQMRQCPPRMASDWQVCICMYMCAYACICRMCLPQMASDRQACICMYVCVYACICKMCLSYVCMHVSVRIHARTYIHAYIYKFSSQVGVMLTCTAAQ